MADQIDLNSLPIAELGQIKEQLEQEIQVLTQSFIKLNQAQLKFKSCITSIASLNDKGVLIPLTNSLYVGGQISNTETVIVDVGTGYFVEKGVVEAADYYKRKVEYVKNNLMKLEQTIVQRQGHQKILMQVLRTKMQDEAQQLKIKAVN